MSWDDTRRDVMTVQLDEFKTRQRDVWAAGDYASLSVRIADVGQTVVGRAEIEPGVPVLDVACGTGNAAIPAARAGARVTALDLTPRLLEAGREKAEAEGLDIEWVEGDAEQLPFDDGSFDRVLSTFGHMFAPRHRETADGMARLCREGGLIVVATWTADGVFGELFAAGASYQPPPPDYAQPPVLWGTEDYIREMFGPFAKDITIERHVNWVEEESVEAFADLFTSKFPPLVVAQAMLGERFAELRETMVGIWEKWNAAEDGSFRLPQDYLVSLVRL
jgi:ubiquinone/menaquinone biosynthesis C-methylase UbiE